MHSVEKQGRPFKNAIQYDLTTWLKMKTLVRLRTFLILEIVQTFTFQFVFQGFFSTLKN